MGMFGELKEKGKDLQEETGYKNSPYVMPGEYLHKILGVTTSESYDKGKKFYIIELKVVKATEGSLNIVGSEPSRRITIPGVHNYGMIDVNKFLMAAMGSLSLCSDGPLPTEENITAEVADWSCESANTLMGQYILTKAFNIVTKEKKQDFTVVEHSTPDDAKALVNDDPAQALGL